MDGTGLLATQAIALAGCVAALIVQRRRALRTAAQTETLQTDLRLVREAFAAQQHFAAVGSLTAPFAHGANNRLTVILSCLDIMATAGLPAEDASHAAELAAGAAQRLSHDMVSLLRGARRQAPQPCVIQLHERLPTVSRLFAQCDGSAVAIDVKVPAGLAVTSDPDLFDAAMLRLLVFARRVGASAVTVTATILDIEQRMPDRPLLRQGRYCALEFKLSGAALTEPLLRPGPEPGHVFDRLLDPDGLELAAAEAYATSLRGQVRALELGDKTAVVEMLLPALSRNER